MATRRLPSVILLTAALFLHPPRIHSQTDVPPDPKVNRAELPTMLDVSAAGVPSVADCVPNAPSGYKKKVGGKCKITLKRWDPINPTDLTVPSGTEIFVVLQDTRWNENVTGAVTATKTPPTDVGAAAIKSFIPGLQQIVAKQIVTPIPAEIRAAVLSGKASAFSMTSKGSSELLQSYSSDIKPESLHLPEQVESLEESIAARQAELLTSTNDVLQEVQAAAASLNCIANYEEPKLVNPDISEKIQLRYRGESGHAGVTKTFDVPSASSPRFSCTQADVIIDEDKLDAGGHVVHYAKFKNILNDVVNRANKAAALPLRTLDLPDLDQVVKAFYVTCLSRYPNMAQRGGADADERTACRSISERLTSEQAVLDTTFTDIAKAQLSLTESVQTIQYWRAPPSPKVFSFYARKHVNMAATIVGTEILTKTNATITSFKITVLNNSIELSAGLSVSNLKSNTYTNSPIIRDGMPVLDPSGKVTTQVTSSAAVPSFVTPLAMISYRLSPLSRADWETRCPNGCAFAISVGLGANLTTKSADFDIGPSFQIGGVLVTPTAHFGRDTRLANGVAVGQMLGSSPPSPLPTAQKWVIKYGFALTYVLPLP